MTPRDRGYQRIISFSTLSSDTTDGNARGAWVLPVWLRAPGSAANLQPSSATLSHCRPTGAHVCDAKKNTNKRQYSSIWKTRENKTTFTNTSTTVLFGDISLQIFSYTFSKVVTVAYIQLFPVPPTTTSALSRVTCSTQPFPATPLPRWNWPLPSSLCPLSSEACSSDTFLMGLHIRLPW